MARHTPNGSREILNVAGVLERPVLPNSPCSASCVSSASAASALSTRPEMAPVPMPICAEDHQRVTDVSAMLASTRRDAHPLASSESSAPARVSTSFLCCRLVDFHACRPEDAASTACLISWATLRSTVDATVPVPGCTTSNVDGVWWRFVKEGAMRLRTTCDMGFVGRIVEVVGMWGVVASWIGEGTC